LKGIRDRLLKMNNPDAHIVSDIGQSMQAYYDDKRKVWVFPGEDPDELAKPIGPPPTLVKTPKPTSSTSADTLARNDPLAAMMAPPQRAPSAFRGRALGGTPNSLSLANTPQSLSSAKSPPQFVVFQPKQQTTQETKVADD